MSKRITGILLVACLGLGGIERADADQPCEGILCGSGAANRHAARTGFLVGLAQLGQDLARAVTDRIYNSTFLGEDWFWGGMAESHNRSINEKFGDLVGEHNYIGPEEIPGLRAVGAEIFNNVAMEAATAGIVAGGPLAQRGLRALRGMPKWQRGAVDVGVFGPGWVAKGTGGRVVARGPALLKGEPKLLMRYERVQGGYEEALARARAAVTPGQGIETFSSTKLREDAGRGISYREQIDLSDLKDVAPKPNEVHGRWLEMTEKYEHVEKMMLHGPQKGERRFHLRMGRMWDSGSTNPLTGIHSRTLGGNYDWEGGIGFMAPEGQGGVTVDWVDIVDTLNGQVTRITHPF